MKTINDVEIKDKRVFCRVDFNVPMDTAGKIADDSRIKAALPTIKYAVLKGAKLIIASHLGRPKGKPALQFSLKPVADHLGELMGKKVTIAPDCVGDKVHSLVRAMKPGDVLVLENLRFHGEEQKNDENFAKELASLCDVYVNDAFAVSHRKNASVEAIVKYAPVAAAGFLLKKELDYIGKAMSAPVRPFVAVIGGVKISSKLKALENMLEKVDKIIIGGAMANTFLKARGYGVGKSLVEDDMIDAAKRVMEKSGKSGINFYIPVDFVAGEKIKKDSAIKMVPAKEIPEGWMALDIGPATVTLYSEALYDAKTIIWNGPMGVFEIAPFSRGTIAMANIIAGSHAMSITGGGDTDAAVHMAGAADGITYISTGGGAFLSLLEGKQLPAVKALAHQTNS